jgi:hypothetical protein
MAVMSVAIVLPCGRCFAATSVLTRSYDNARTGAITTETVLTPDVVSHGLTKRFSLVIPDDPRIEAQPLYVPRMKMPDGKTHDVLYVFSMANTVWAFDARTGAALWPHSISLGAPFRPTPGDAVDTNPPINVAWGILSTPVIDLPSSTLFIVNWQLDGHGNRVLFLNALRLRDGHMRHAPLVIHASVVNSAGQTISLNPVQKQRAALLLVPLRGAPKPSAHKMLYVAFTGAEQMPAGGTPATVNHGWVVAFDVTSWRQAAAWNVTPSSFGGGIWQGAQGPAADNLGHVYVLTGNGGYLEAPGGGTQEFNGHTDFSESFVKLEYVPGTPGSLAVADWFSPFLDSHRHDFTAPEVAPLPKGYDYTDQDMSSAGPLLPPGMNLVLGAGKDGVLYVLDPQHMGQAIGDFSKLKVPPSFITWTPDPGISSYAGASPEGNLDFKPVPGVKTHHLHGTPVYWKSAAHGPMLFVWGENETLRAWSLAASGQTTFLARGAEIASAQLASTATVGLGGMPGGMLALSANGDHDGILWATAPLDQDANRAAVPGIIRAYDASTFDTDHPNPDGSTHLRMLWSAAGFTYSKFCPPVVADGQLFVPTYDGRIDVYGP